MSRLSNTLNQLSLNTYTFGMTTNQGNLEISTIINESLTSFTSVEDQLNYCYRELNKIPDFTESNISDQNLVKNNIYKYLEDYHKNNETIPFGYIFKIWKEI